MTTPAISNSANILAASAPAPGNPASQASAAEQSFHQVLQREISEKRDADQTKKMESRSSGDAAPQSTTSKPSSETKKAESPADEQEGSKDADQSDQVGDAAHASAELLALVADMAQIGNPAAMEAKDVDPEVTLDADIASGRGRKTAANIEMLAENVASDERGSAADGKLAAQSAFSRLANDIAKDAGNAERGTQLSAEQTALAAPIEKLGSATQTAVVTPETTLLPMQHALKAQSATTHASESLTAPVGTPAWDQAVGQKVVWMVAGAQQSASLTLNPPDLGPMQIVLNVSNAQANATFVAAQPEVRQALEAALPRLREMLGDAGIQLGQANINAGNPQQGNSFDSQGNSSSRRFAHDMAEDQPVSSIRTQSTRHVRGMVDTFA